MLGELVDSNIALGVCVVEEFLFSGVCVCRINISEFAKTIGGTILQYIDDTTSTYVLTTSTFVTTESKFGVELDREILCNLYVSLEVDVGTAYTRTKDDTLVFTLSQREIELHLVGTTTDSNVG